MMFDPITRHRLMETSERVFETYAEHLFEQNRLYSKYARDQIPLIGGGDYNVEGGYSKQRRLVIDALRSQYLFSLLAPPWAPRLPLKPQEREMLAHDPDPRLQAVALFAQFLHAHDWHVSEVHDFPDFVRALLADPRTPAEIRSDQRLRKEFLSKPVAARSA
jgi:hypothetical protein